MKQSTVDDFFGLSRDKKPGDHSTSRSPDPSRSKQYNKEPTRFINLEYKPKYASDFKINNIDLKK